ncbi:hypothetical protein ACFLQP_00795 [Acidobacteriota bacterium]
MKVITKSMLLLISVIALNVIAVVGGNVKLIERIEISLENRPLINPLDFCVTDDELFLLPDFEAGNIKVYEISGNLLKLVTTIGRKGYGPDELSKPTFCFYNEAESKFVVMDYGIRKIFIYDRIDRINFKRIKEISCWRPGYDIKLEGNNLFISGYMPDSNGTPYDLYYVDLTKDEKDPNQKTFLLPSYTKYGLNSFRQYEKEYRSKLDFIAMGILGWFDIYKDIAYFIWEGNLKIIKINFLTGKIDTKHFGTQPPHYVKPYASEKLLESYDKQDFNITRKEKSKMSYVRNIFVNSKYVLVIYEGPIKQDSGANFWLQFYTLDGGFIKEVPIPGALDRKMWFDKGRDILFSLCENKENASGKGYFISKYIIVE